MRQAVVASCAVAAVLAAVALNSASGSGAASEPVPVPVQPAARTIVAPPSTVSPPPLLADVERLAPTTVTIETTVDGRAATSQVVTRTTDRVQLVLDGQRREWLFVRNPVNRDRVSGYLIDHDAQLILEYDDTDLLAREGLRGWADVIMMRFDRRSLSAMRETGEVERRWGAEFRRSVSSDGTPGVVEVWWNEELLLPLRITVRNNAVRVTSTVVALSATHDAAGLDEPRSRFPSYQSLHIADSADHRP